MSEELRRVGELFEIEGAFVSALPHGSGHIHGTWVATYAEGDSQRRFVHQRLNTDVFRDPRAVCDNVARVTGHLRAKLAARGSGDPDRRCLRLVRARSGETCAFHADGVWRTFHFIEGTTSHDVMADPEQARQTARAFASFLVDMADLPAPGLAVTIPGFHDLPGRAEQFRAQWERDPLGRAAGAGAEGTLAEALLDRLERALREQGPMDLPRRIVHNDCKLNNLLLDADSGEGLCVIDLDTVMEGDIRADFGELARTGTCRAAEDERDLAAIVFDRDLFAGLAEGYLTGAAGLLSADERSALPLAGPTLALENGLRFLSDHVAGDRYFRIHRPGQNLDRARAQLTLTASMLDGVEDARRIVASL